MSEDSEIFKKIEGFVRGTLNDEDKDQFMEMIEGDPELPKKVKLYKESVQGIKDNNRLDWLVKMKQWDQEMKKEPMPWYRKNLTRYISIAASVLILAFTSVYFFYPGLENEDLVDEFYSDYDFTSKGDEDSIVVMVSTLYSEKEYLKASRTGWKALEKASNNIGLNFYTGLSLLAAKKPKKAVLCLEFVNESQSIDYSYHAKWYLGLAYLLEGKVEKTKQLLEGILNDGIGPHLSNASNLLEKLNGKH